MELKEMKTERITLREINKEDWNNYVNHVIDADEIYVQYGYEPTPGLIDYIQEPTPEVIYYSIIDNAANEMVGYIGILEENNSIEFYTFKEYRNNNYCTEALKLFVKSYLNGDMTGTQHNEIVGETLSKSEASIHILKKAGFEKEAVGFRICFGEDSDNITAATALRKYVYKKEKQNGHEE